MRRSEPNIGRSTGRLLRRDGARGQLSRWEPCRPEPSNGSSCAREPNTLSVVLWTVQHLETNRWSNLIPDGRSNGVPFDWAHNSTHGLAINLAHLWAEWDADRGPNTGALTQPQPCTHVEPYRKTVVSSHL